jgi:mRNA-degrading endonuclease RelE of RelBE toxin-antitoxin system
MKLLFSKNFIRDYRSLPLPIQKTADKQLGFLLTNLHHPSLNVKKMQGYFDIWEGRITYSYRFTFKIEKDVYALRRVGKHDILNHP